MDQAALTDLDLWYTASFSAPSPGSANTPVGYPMVHLRDIESGKVRATRE